MANEKLILEPQTAVQRRLSIPEYYHAAVGRSARTLEPPRISTMLVEGVSAIAPERWRAALHNVALANPGTRMRLLGRRQRARWTTTDAVYPQLRFVEHCSWDGRSEQGMEFVESTVLDLEQGPVVELIIASGDITRVILRTPHAVMDGMGMLHFFRELFRALRAEPLLGCNAAFSDVELMQAVNREPWRGAAPVAPIPLTGGAQGDELGDVWQRLTLPLTPQQNIMGRIAALATRHATSFGDGPVRFAVPVNLRRHLPRLVSTLNFTGLLHIDLASDETAEDFRAKLRAALNEKKDAAYYAGLEWLRYLPFSWIDYLTGRRPGNYLQRKLVETVLITNFGALDLNEFCCEGFTAENFYSLPVGGNSLISMYASGPHINVMVGMPKIYASGGRLAEFVQLLREELTVISY